MKKKTIAPLLVVLIAGVVLGSATTYMVSSPLRQVPPDMKRQSSDAERPPKADKITHYTPSYDSKGDLTFKEREEETPGAKGETAVVDALNAYLRRVPAVPKEAVVTKVTMDGTTANLEFSPQIRAGYGTEDEQALVNGILVTLSQFPQIKKAAFLVNGQPLDSLGNIDLSEPQEVHGPAGP